jgi:hypothetical protein
MNTWSLRGTAAAVGVATVIGGIGGAAVYAATDSGPRMMGMHSGPGPGQGAQLGGPRNDLAREAAPDSVALHGEFVVADGTGGFNAVITQTGRVTAISPTSVTARSEDGYIQTYVIAASSPGAAATPPFAVNDDVTIRATRTGQVASVTTISYARTRGGPTGPPVASHP